MATNWGADIGTGASAGALIGGPVGAAVGAVGGLGLGLWENHKNKEQAKKDEANRPQYQIPDEYKQQLSLVQQQSLQGMPQEQQQQFINNLQQSTAYGLNQLGTRNAGLAGVAQLNQNQNQGLANLASMSAQMRVANQDKYINQLGLMGDQKSQQFQLNKLNPYNVGVARNNANTGVLYQNLNNSLQLGSQALGLMKGYGGQSDFSGVNLPSADSQFQNILNDPSSYEGLSDY